jgi:hypothetical protein
MRWRSIFISPTISRPSIKLVENSHPTTALVVTLNANHEECVLREQADTSARSSIICKAYASKDINKHNKDESTTWSTIGGQFTTDKTGLGTFLFPELNIKKQSI